MTARNNDLCRWLRNTVERDTPPTQAAVLLVCEGARGDLPERLVSCIVTDPPTRRAWIDWGAAVALSQRFSGGERRLVALAASLASGVPVVLSDALTGLDDRNSALVAELLAHAVGVDLEALARGDHQ